MLVYYLVLLVLVPFISTNVVDFVGIPNGSYLEMGAEHTISLSIFFLVIPNIWNTIDERTEKRIIEKVGIMKDDDDDDDDDHETTTTTTTTEDKSETDKKDD